MYFMGLDLGRKPKGACLLIRLLVSIPICSNWHYKILRYPLRGEVDMN